MDQFRFSVLILALLSSVSHAALPAQIYWKAALPNTPMPNAIKERIPAISSLSDNKGTDVDVGHGGVNVNNGGWKTFEYEYAATQTQLHDDPQVALFFLEDHLQPNNKMRLHFTETTPHSAFITLSQARSIPFSSEKLPQILDHFSVSPNSKEADTMKRTLQDCEKPALDGETKYCATSLESMVEFSTRSLGTRDVKVVSTAVGKEGMGEMEFEIENHGVGRMKGDKLVVCHSEEYKYAVFYCHATSKSRAYSVKMVAGNGAGIEAVAVCHTNTAAWNPNHIAFRVLQVKPGTVPVCHFLPQDHVVWAARG